MRAYVTVGTSVSLIVETLIEKMYAFMYNSSEKGLTIIYLNTSLQVQFIIPSH